jgi:HSP20 family protein
MAPGIPPDLRGVPNQNGELPPVSLGRSASHAHPSTREAWLCGAAGLSQSTLAAGANQHMSTLTLWNPFRRSEDLRLWRARDRWNPVREIENLHTRMNQWMASWPDGEEAMTVSDWSPLVDILEQNGEYLLKAEVPEVRKEDLKVRVEDGTLQIVGERKSEKEEKGRKFHRMERSYGSFERSFSLPEDVDATKVSSEFKDGILQIHLPKTQAAKTKAIEVKVQ